MKVKHFLLGAAIVALMAACGGKQQPAEVTETPAETLVEEVETVVEEAQETVEAVAETKAPATKKQTTTTQTTKKAETKPAVDPCESAVSTFSRYVAELEVAKKQKDSGIEAMKKYKQLKDDAANQEAKVKDCMNNEAHKKVIQTLMMKEKTLRSN